MASRYASSQGHTNGNGYDLPPVAPSTGPTRRNRVGDTPSPITTRSGRILGSSKKSGAGGNYSPYARRTAPAPAPRQDEDEHKPGMLRRALGYFWRGSGSGSNGGGMKESQSMNSLSSMNGGGEEKSIESTGARKGRGLPNSTTTTPANMSALKSRSRTVGDLKALDYGKDEPVRVNRRDRERSAHSTLVLPSTSTSNSRQGSPFMPPPPQNDLFHPPPPSAKRLNLPPSPTRSNIFPSSAASQHSSHAPPPTSTNFGLTSRSPFSHGGGINRSMSVSSIPSYSNTNPLFPYASPKPRGMSPSLSISSLPHHQHQYGRNISPSRPLLASGGGMRRTSTMAFGRSGSPLRAGYLNGHAAGDEESSSQVGQGGRKKQVVWDPIKGLVRSREEMERDRPEMTIPKNDAERILETLEGMGRTPLGGGTSFVRTKEIPVPTTSHSHSHHFSPTTPYARNKAKDSVRSGTGLSAVFRAREERRRAAEEEERREREKEREKEEKRLRKEKEREREMVMSDGEDGKTERRKTRSMAKDKSPAPASTVKKSAAKGKGKAQQQQQEESLMVVDTPSKPTRSSRRTAKSPSPAPVPTPIIAPSPPPPAKSPTPPPPPTQTQQAKQQTSSLRPGRSHSSRQHTQSSRISSPASFSAREEDLPEVSEEDLGKIKLPVGMFPEGFTFGAGANVGSKVEEKKVVESVKEPEKKENGNGLLDRMGPPPPAPALEKEKATTPSFSFAPPPPATTTSTTPSFSFASPSPTPPAPTFSFAPPPKLTPSSDFFAKPSPAPMSTPPPNSTSNGKPPAFFSAVLEEKKPTPPPSIAAPTAFSFAPASTTPAPTAAPAPAPAPAPTAASNAFAAFGKPIAEVVKEDGKTEKEKESTPVFGAPVANGSAFGKKEEKPATPFAFGNTSSTPAPPAPTTPSLFGAPAQAPPSASAVEPPKPATPFSFGSTAPTSTSTPAASPFSFGNTIPSKPAPAPAASIFGAAAPAIEDPDEDSGMEDETGTADSLPAPVATKPISTGFNFGTPAASPPPTAFGSNGGGFSFGAAAAAAEKKDAPSPFAFGQSSGPPASASTTAPKFGAFGSPSPSPAPQSPSAPTFGAAAGGFTFGAPKPATPAPASPFTFGGAPATPSTSTPANPFGGNAFGGVSAAPAMSQTLSAPGFSTAPTATGMFGSTTPAAPTPFTFGSAAPAQSQTAPSTPGAASPFQFGTPAAATTPFAGFGAAAPSGSTFNFAAPAQPSAPGTPTGGAIFNLGPGGDESPGKAGRRIAPMRKKRA